MSTYDQSQRASLYQQVQEEIAAQVPYIFLWAVDSYGLVRSAVTTIDGPLDLTLPYWGCEPDRMVVAASQP
jgi:ABC-type transport system substrate-binding protein